MLKGDCQWKKIDEYFLFNVDIGGKLWSGLVTNTAYKFLLETTIVITTPFTTRDMISDSMISLNKRGLKYVGINKKEI